MTLAERLRADETLLTAWSAIPDPLVAEFTKLIFSKEGQEVVIKDGYMPISADIAKQELAKVSGKSGT